MRITIVAGARPNFMKIAPLIREIKSRANSGIQYRLVHTGQHYSEKLSDIFFQELEIPHPDSNLMVGSGTQAEQTGKIMMAFEKELIDHPTDLVIVVGDVNSTMACTIVAKKLQIKVAHIEAGIRSFDMAMPEEINRIVTDALADYFFTTSDYANSNLKKTGVDDDRIFYVGNVMIDTLNWAQDKLRQPSQFDEFGLELKNYFVITLHRPSNVDDLSSLEKILTAIESSIGENKAVFPVHPRTAKMLEQSNWKSSKIKLTEPLSYFEFVYLVKHSRAVITDSGGIQEETTCLHVPCLTLRLNTERPETITTGTNELIGNDMGKLRTSLHKIVEGNWRSGGIPALWDGNTAVRIVDELMKLS